jgi:hypothetical protein
MEWQIIYGTGQRPAMLRTRCSVVGAPLKIERPASAGWWPTSRLTPAVRPVAVVRELEPWTVNLEPWVLGVRLTTRQENQQASDGRLAP